VKRTSSHDGSKLEVVISNNETKEERKLPNLNEGMEYLIQLYDRHHVLRRTMTAVLSHLTKQDDTAANCSFAKVKTSYPCVSLCHSTSPYTTFYSGPGTYDESHNTTTVTLPNTVNPPEIGTTINIYRWNLFSDPNPRWETHVTSVVSNNDHSVSLVLKDVIQAPYAVNSVERDEKTSLTSVAFSSDDTFLFFSTHVQAHDKKITISNSSPSTLNIRKDQNIKVFLFTNFVNAAAGWNCITSTDPLVLHFDSHIHIPSYSSNFVHNYTLKSVQETASHLLDRTGALQADDDFEIPSVTRVQKWKIGSNGKFWHRGSNQGEVTTGANGTAFTVEQGTINNQIIISDGKGSYLRAVKMLPYVILEFGASRSQATSFAYKWLSNDKVILSTTGVHGGSKCRKATTRAWVTHDKFVYLSKKSPNDSVQDTDAVLTIHRL